MYSLNRNVPGITAYHKPGLEQILIRFLLDPENFEPPYGLIDSCFNWMVVNATYHDIRFTTLNRIVNFLSHGHKYEELSPEDRLYLLRGTDRLKQVFLLKIFDEMKFYDEELDE